ncbi:MAG: dUTP diphosphatase [Alphaproteobacteria bacterium]|nr:dUTP diphosphatase [Alphaproteobacteria bacterium]
MTGADEQGIGIKIQRLPHAGDLPLPAYATAGSAGVDLAAAVEAEVILPPGGRALIPTGFAIALPDGFEAQVRPRSGLAVRDGVSVLNAPGTIDADYRGEVKVCLVNQGERPFTVRRGERIAQMVVAPVSRLQWSETQALDATARDTGGFGSTGKDASDAGHAQGGRP